MTPGDGSETVQYIAETDHSFISMNEKNWNAQGGSCSKVTPTVQMKVSGQLCLYLCISYLVTAVLKKRAGG